MLLRASLLALVLGGLSVGCGGSKKGGTLMVDIPVLPYKAPDIEELSGVSDDDSSEPETPPEPEAKTEAPPPTPLAATPAPTAPTAPAPKAPAAPAKAVTPAPKQPAAPATPVKK